MWDTVLEKVLPLLGNRWSRNDMVRMWNFCTTTSPAKVEFLQMFCRYMQDSKTFRVPTHFFDWVAAVPARLQAVRLCLCVAMVASDLDTECQEPAGLRTCQTCLC